jgi:hypothetical protein
MKRNGMTSSRYKSSIVALSFRNYLIDAVALISSLYDRYSFRLISVKLCNLVTRDRLWAES